MREEADNEKLLIQYLLGSLPEQEQLQVERIFLGDDQQYERLLTLENELFYDYTQGTLSPAEREQFERRFLASERNRKRAMLASALAHKRSEAVPAEPGEIGLARREPRLWWQSLRSFFSLQSRAIKLSLAAMALLLLISIWLIAGIVRWRNELSQFRVQRAAQEDRLQQQARQERARADELNRKLEREMDETSILRQELSKMQARLQEQGEILPSVISFILAPSFVRDQATGIKNLYIPPSARTLKLQLNLRGNVKYKSYQVILLTVDGAEIWSQGMLQAKRTGTGQAIELNLPSKLLEEGDYELRLKGYAADGTLEETRNYYYISIVR
jgi:anti-sigma factor RsiW